MYGSSTSSSSCQAAASVVEQPQPTAPQRRRRPRRSVVASGAALIVAVGLALVLLLACGPAPARAFLLPSPSTSTPVAARRPLVGNRMGSVVVMMAEGESGEEVGPQPKGFGKKSSNKKAAAAPAAAAEADMAAPAAAAEGEASKATPEDIAKLNARQKMAYWEIQKEMEREYDMMEIEEYKETQRLLDEGVVGYLPEKISNRMLKRLIPFITMPLLGAGGMFGFYLYLAKNTDIDVPPAFVAFSTQVPFLGALAGITYSIMSTSWDPDVEGSFWGVTEFKANVLNLLDSLQKSKREERAKEKMKKYERTPAPNRAKRRELDRLTK